MTLAQVLDVVYVHQVDLLERRVTEARLHAVIAAANGAEGVEIPDLDQARADFDKALTKPPVPVTRAEREREDLLEAMFGEARR
jgi:hypothetical protein